MSVQLQKFGLMMQKFFQGSQIEGLAYRTGFVQRPSKLTGAIFVQALVFACVQHNQATLNHFAQSCHDLGVEISPQGFDERFKAASVALLKQMFEVALKQFINQVALPLPILSQFKAINIIDSSTLALPPALAELYPGSGGNAASASLKIRLVFEFLAGNLSQLCLSAGRQPDQGFKAYLQVLKPASLNLMDLGHFNLDNFKTILSQLAYFLSRYKSDVALLSLSGDRLDLLQLLQSRCQSVLDQAILLGLSQEHQLACRLVAFRLPQEVADQRRYKLKAAAKRRRQSVSQTRLALCDWSIFVTNVPVWMLSAQQVAWLYRLRWQIELIFKLYKSYAGLRTVAQVRHDRLFTELYARLIGLVLTHFLAAPLRMPEGRLANREISPVQVRQIFQRCARCLCRTLGHLDRLTAELADMLAQIKRFGFKQKRTKKPNICHALALASTVFHLQFTPQQQLELLML